MKCPVCKDVTLAVNDRQGIEIDHCPDCRGVWLDRGELDKLIERAAPATAPQNRAQPHFEDSDHGRDAASQRRPQKSWLRDIFD